MPGCARGAGRRSGGVAPGVGPFPRRRCPGGRAISAAALSRGRAALCPGPGWSSVDIDAPGTIQELLKKNAFQRLIESNTLKKNARSNVPGSTRGLPGVCPGSYIWVPGQLNLF